MEPLKRYSPHLLYILPALVFAAAGAAKLAGAPVALKSFSDMALPPLFGTFIGLCEIAGAGGLLLPRTRILAASGLFAIMLGAIYYHVTYSEPSVFPSLVLIALLLATILRFRKAAA